MLGITREAVTTRQNKNNNDTFLAFLAFLLGLFSATNIAYVYTVGNTHILVSEAYSVALLFVMIFYKRIKPASIVHTVPGGMKAFLGIIIFSAVPAVINFYDQAGVLTRYVVGVIYLCILLTIIIDVMCLFDFRRYIIYGIEMGIIINVILCIIQYIVYRSGIVFDILYKAFPQGAFHLSVYNFGAQGLFLEPSHLIWFLGMVLPIILVWVKKDSIRRVYLAMIIIVAVLSAAGTALILLLALALYFTFKIDVKKSLRAQVKISTILTSYFLVAALLILLLSGVLDGVFSTMMSYWKVVVSGSNIMNSENADRLISIQNVSKLLLKFPLGCGWNMAPTVIGQNTDLTTAAAFSDLLETTLELSIVGITVYVVSMVSIVLRLFATKSKEAIGYAIAIIDILVMQTMADCSFNSAMFIVFGLAISYLYSLKMRQDLNLV